MSNEIEVRQARVEVHGRYLVRAAEGATEGTLVGFHGFGETAESNLGELRLLPGLRRWNLVSVQALHPFYRRTGEIVACWMTSLDREQAIEENIAYVGAVLRQVRNASPEGPLAALGFSQGTAMAYRAAAFGGVSLAGVIALGGDVPPELADLDGLPFDKVLIGRGHDEDWYSSEKMAQDVALLETQGLRPEVFEFAGGHEFTDAFRHEAARFLLSLA